MSSRAAALSASAAAFSAFARMAVCAAMTTLELNAVAPQTTHRFFELMVPSLTSAAIWSSSLDGRAMCVGTSPANVLL